MPYETLLFDLRDAIAFITINRPDKLNALNDQVVDELADAAERVATEDAIKGAILSGAGQKAFVAGADIAELAKQGPFDGKARALRGQAMLRRLETCGKPVIAAVNGYALGGGCELAMACHLRIASDAAKFGQPEVKLGIAPGYGGTQRLPRLVGKGNALHMILTGEMIDAREAYRTGLVNQVVPAAELLAAAEKTLQGILAMGHRVALLVRGAIRWPSAVGVEASGRRQWARPCAATSPGRGWPHGWRTRRSFPTGPGWSARRSPRSRYPRASPPTARCSCGSRRAPG